MDVSIDHYLDGGTAEISISENGITKTFFVDNRLKSQTKGRVYDAYPDKGKLVGPNTEQKILELYNANKKY